MSVKVSRRIVIPSPDTPNQTQDEFGDDVAAYGNYFAIAASQDSMGGDGKVYVYAYDASNDPTLEATLTPPAPIWVADKDEFSGSGLGGWTLLDAHVSITESSGDARIYKSSGTTDDRWDAWPPSEAKLSTFYRTLTGNEPMVLSAEISYFVHNNGDVSWYEDMGIVLWSDVDHWVRVSATPADHQIVKDDGTGWDYDEIVSVLGGLPQSDDPWIYKLFVVPPSYGSACSFDDEAVGTITLNPGEAQGYVSVDDGSSWSASAVLSIDFTPTRYGGFQSAMAAGNDIRFDWVKIEREFKIVGFGDTVAMFYCESLQDTLLVVGAPNSGNDDGAVCVYRRNGGAWPLLQPALRTALANSGSRLGSGLDAHGDRIIAGAPFDDPGGNSSAGSAVLFKYNSGTGKYVEETRLVPSISAASDYAGEEVAIGADRCIVGSCNGGTSGYGAIHVFLLATYAEETAISNADAQSFFGCRALTYADPWVVVGEPFSWSASNPGRARAWKRSGTSWSEATDALIPANASAADEVGISVHMRDPYLLIGAWHHDETGYSNCGAAYLYIKTDDGFIELLKFQPETLVANQRLAGENMVAVGNGYFVVGAPSVAASGNHTAYVFEFTLGTTKTYGKNPLQATVEAMGDAIYEHRGFRMSRLRGAHVEHDITLLMESTHLFSRTYETMALIDSPESTIATPDTANKATDEFGWAVDHHRQWLVAGAPQSAAGGTGKVYVYRRNAAGAYAYFQTLTASDAAAGDRFGWAVSVHDDQILAGAPYDDSQKGAAYLFTLDAYGEFAQAQKLVPSAASAGDEVGTSVAIDSTRLILGAPLADTAAGAESGTAFVYAYNSTTGQYAEDAQLTPADAAASNHCGLAVDIQATRAAVCGVNAGPTTNEGACYIWSRASGAWAEEQKLVGDGVSGDRFGISCSLDADRIAIGATYAAAATTTGKVYVWTRRGTTWTKTKTLTAVDEAAGNAYGAAVSLLNPYCLVAAPGMAVSGTSGAGKLYLYDYLARTATWTETAKITASDLAASQGLGGAYHGGVVLTGRHAVAGSGAVGASGGFQLYLNQIRSCGKVGVDGEAELLDHCGLYEAPGACQIVGCDPLTGTRHTLSEVVDASRNSSKLDKLRRATLVEYSEGQDLDRVGREDGLGRPRGYSDAKYREIVKATAFTYRGTKYAAEILLDSLFPDGGWAIYEDLVNHPGEVYFTIPGEIGTKTLGRFFLPAREDLTADTALQVTVTDDPTTVESVKLQPYELTLENQGTLPSAAATAWTFVPELAGAEGTYFTAASWVLQHAHPAGTNGGRYERAIYQLSEDYWAVDINWRATSVTTVADKPWNVVVRDGEREICLMWDATTIYLGHRSGTSVTSIAQSGLTSAWWRLRVERDGSLIHVYANGHRILTQAASSFNASAAREIEFGFVNRGSSNQWTAEWGDLVVYARSNREHWNLQRTDGSLSAGSDLLTSALGLFVAGDASRIIFLDADEDKNYGLWQAIARPGATQLQLDGYLWRSAGYADSLASDRYYTYEDRFVSQDAAKSLVIPTSAVGNADTYPILTVESAREVKLDITGHPGGLVTEKKLGFKFLADFATESGIDWELIAAGSAAAAVLTLRETLPDASAAVRVLYTTSLSGVLRRNETVARDDAYPGYIGGVDERLQALLDNMTAAGIIPRFLKGY